ncbi:MAG: sigma 54-interacting transcriptional regulator [Lawsonibacter sp.]|nr:sigma 54-interacting transcriptional regulator [Lawsonibacter sp.]
MNELKILAYVQQQIDESRLDAMRSNGKYVGVTANDIEHALHIARSNASAALNLLEKKGSLIKINSRPVYFFPTAPLLHLLHVAKLESSYSPEDFERLMQPPTAPRDPFDNLVGIHGSLLHQVEQAKAAILYPPKGLHTLIIGESGTGKTMFARAMYEFGVSALKKDHKSFPYVEFNCADYYHNPQLLMSHLFGHTKGAFTGANQETSGLVEKANGGILFLDEVHRLSPEGQELLFYLMDTGRYRKLGETDNLRQAQVLIIAATTESPDGVLTRTFMRRIPLTLSLPPYRDRLPDERLQIIQSLFQREAATTQKTYVISPEVLRALISDDFPGNIGQLTNEIKVLCARVFLNNDSNTEELDLSSDSLSPAVWQHYKQVGGKTSFARYQNLERLVVYPDAAALPCSLSEEHTAYERLMDRAYTLAAQGQNKEEVAETLAEQVREYCNDILKNCRREDIRKDELYKVVDSEIVDFTNEVLQSLTQSLEVDCSQRNILVLSLHFKYLLDRTHTANGVSKTQIVHMEQVAQPELSAANQIVSALERRFHTQVPPEEQYFVGILLANMANKSAETESAMFIVAHGASTASSIASVCNRLMNCDFVHAVDAPLDQDVEDTYCQLLHEVQRLPEVKSVILLVDMGSLTTFGDKITQETGIPTKTLVNVTTLLALDVARNLLGHEYTVETIYQKYQAVPLPAAPLPKPKEPAVLTICASGVGTSEAFRARIADHLAAAGMAHIHVLSLSLNDLQSKTESYQAIRTKFNVLACVSNMNCSIDVPLFHISQLISEQGRQDFLHFIHQSDDTPEGDVLTESIHFLSENVMCLNPEMAVPYCEQFLEAVNLPQVQSDRELHLSLLLHLGFMLERIVCRKDVLFDDRDVFIAQHAALFNTLRSKSFLLESAFDITLNDSELCFIIQAITQYHPKYLV